MNQEKISEFIKQIRNKENLSQEAFGKIYGVTYQAVSKWENGKNLPDIAILKNICNDYNQDINELLDNNIEKKRSKKIIILISSIVLILIIIILCLVLHNNDAFNFKTIKTTCDDFDLYGSIAYSNSKTSIYITNITYCGTNKNTKYQNIECILYEVKEDTKRVIEKVNYDEETTLEDFLEKVKFNVEHYSTSCNMYKKNGMILEIKGTTTNNENTFYEIPLVLEENC